MSNVTAPISPASFDEKITACKVIAINIINSFIQEKLGSVSYITIYLKDFKEAIPKEIAQEERNIIIGLFSEMEKIFREAGWNVGYVKAYQYYDVTDSYIHISKNMAIKLS